MFHAPGATNDHSAPKLVLNFRKASQQAAIRAAHQFDGGLTIDVCWKRKWGENCWQKRVMLWVKSDHCVILVLEKYTMKIIPKIDCCKWYQLSWLSRDPGWQFTGAWHCIAEFFSWAACCLWTTLSNASACRSIHDKTSQATKKNDSGCWTQMQPDFTAIYWNILEYIIIQL